MPRLEILLNQQTCFEAALEISPQDHDARFRLGFAYSRTGRPKEAILCFNKVLKKDPSNTDAMINKGIAYIALRRFKNSISCFDKALKKDKDNFDAMLSQVTKPSADWNA